MKSNNIVFIAKSIDGFIAKEDGNIDWLNAIPNPDNDDMGTTAFFNRIDAIVMGRKTYEIVLSFGIDWPYKKPVFVLSNTLTTIPDDLVDKISIIKGSPSEITELLNAKGFYEIYIDGGTTIQNYLQADLIDEMIITTIPIVLGGGIPLFGKLKSPLHFTHEQSNVFLNEVVQNAYKRKR